jgi:hypothetical protein
LSLFYYYWGQTAVYSKVFAVTSNRKEDDEMQRAVQAQRAIVSDFCYELKLTQGLFFAQCLIIQ